MSGGTLNVGGFMGDARNQEGVSGTSGGCNLKTAEATKTLTAATTGEILVNVPAGATIVGCQLRNDVVVTSGDGGTTYSAAYKTGATQAIGTGIAFAKNTKTNKMFDPNNATPITSGVTTVELTCDDAKNFAAGGVVRAIVYYFDFDAMASL